MSGIFIIIRNTTFFWNEKSYWIKTHFTHKKSINQGKTQLQRYTKNQIHTKIRAKPNFRFWRICGRKHIFYRLNFLFAQLWASFNKEPPLTWCEMLGKNIFMIKIFKICSCAIKNENFLQELSDMSTIRQSMDRLRQISNFLWLSQGRRKWS